MTHATLAQTLDASKIEMSRLEHDYAPLLVMVRALIGVVPNCDAYMEIWPPAFRAYNLLVPNALNLPPMLLGLGARKELIGLAMYAASRGAECMYCSAHTCSFAMRRGVSPGTFTGHRSAREEAVWDFATALGQLPHRLEPAHVRALRDHLSPSDQEWLLWAVSLMGFLGKFMDAMGVELEPAAISDVQSVLGDTGWVPGKHRWSAANADNLPDNRVPSDDLQLYVRVLRAAPAALALQRRWTRGLGLNANSALSHLEQQVGYGFPKLRRRRHQRPTSALAAVLRDQLNPKDSPLGLRTKILLGLVYATHTHNDWLRADILALLSVHSPDVDDGLVASVTEFASTEDSDALPPESLPPLTSAALRLSKWISPSPASLTQSQIGLVHDTLTAPQLVEAVVWTAVLQLLHRLYVFDQVTAASTT